MTTLAHEAPHRRIAILTHHSPCITANAIDPEHATGPLASAFATDLSAETCWTSKNVKLWVLGTRTSTAILYMRGRAST